MPRSENRKSLEVPTAVYEQLQAEAKRDGRTVAQVVMDLITDGRDAREHHGRVVDELHENRIEMERMRGQVAELAELVRALAVATSPASIPAGQETTGGPKKAQKKSPGAMPGSN